MKFYFKNKIIKLINWHIWFAWHPAKIDIVNGYKIIWLEKVLRKAIYISSIPESGISDFITYKYKEHNK